MPNVHIQQKLLMTAIVNEGQGCRYNFERKSPKSYFILVQIRFALWFQEMFSKVAFLPKTA
jgi:hypothetical protein